MAFISPSNTTRVKTLREDVIQSGAVIVVYPDSGEPVDVVHTSLMLLDEVWQSGGVRKDMNLPPQDFRLSTFIQSRGKLIKAIDNR